MRLGADMQLDPAFGTGGRRNYDFGSSDDAIGVHLDGGGRIVLAGRTSTPATGGDVAALRLLGDTDATAPTVAQSLFEFETRQAVKLTFSEDVLASVGGGDLVVRNLTTNQTISSTAFTLTTAGAPGGPFTATWVYNAGILPDGNYRATLAAGSVQDPAGNPLAADHVLNFHALAGDANRDGAVNLQDFNRLAANFGQSNRTFTHGDFNYDGTVNLQDFNILAGRFGRQLAPATAGADDEGRDDAGDFKDSLADLLA